jgi:hypothetical protein
MFHNYDIEPSEDVENPNEEGQPFIPFQGQPRRLVMQVVEVAAVPQGHFAHGQPVNVARPEAEQPKRRCPSVRNACSKLGTGIWYTCEGLRFLWILIWLAAFLLWLASCLLGVGCMSLFLVGQYGWDGSKAACGFFFWDFGPFAMIAPPSL